MPHSGYVFALLKYEHQTGQRGSSYDQTADALLDASRNEVAVATAAAAAASLARCA